MDVLASLNIDELPEQQTRMLHLMNEYPDFDLQLGFDACCSCGKQLDTSYEISCRVCKRVKYCSEDCRITDTTCTTASMVLVDNNEEQETALGHTSVVCTLLQTCNDDEDVENGTDTELNTLRRTAAVDRIRSEYESYPATLANVITKGTCYQTVLNQCNQQKKTLCVHIIGASEEAELSPPSPSQQQHQQTGTTSGGEKKRVFMDYAEALGVLSSTYKSILKMELVFVGPECPETNLDCTIPIVSGEVHDNGVVLHIRTIKQLYNDALFDAYSLSRPDIVVFFNPGFTVPEYENWKETLGCIQKGTPFLSATNTEMEGIADCQYLLDQDRIQTIPPALADMFGLYSTTDEEEDEDEVSSVFTENPFRGSRVRQSGTMGNDLFVKNRWILTGILDSYDTSKEKKESVAKRTKTQASSNRKMDNPALI